MDVEIDVIANFRSLIERELQEFMDASQLIGEPIFGLANMVRRAFRNQLSFIIDGVYMERPGEERFREMIEPMSSEINDIQLFRDRNRNVPEVLNHICTISESIVALSWISVANTPAQFVRDMQDAAQYFGNRVLSQHRGNQLHQDWILKWNQVLQALEKYVRMFHTTGFDWNVGTRLNNRGRTIGVGDASVLCQPRGPPPPPPPPSNMDLLPEGGDGRQNLLRDLNQGVGIVRSHGAPYLSPMRSSAVNYSPMSSSAEDPMSPTNSSNSSNYSLGITVPLPRRSPIEFHSRTTTPSSGYPSDSSGSAVSLPSTCVPSSPGSTTDSPLQSEVSLFSVDKSGDDETGLDTLESASSPETSDGSQVELGAIASSSGDIPLMADIKLIREEFYFQKAFSRMLKPVNKEQPSQSQPSLPSTAESVPKKPVAERNYPPKLLLDGRKWRVEHQKDRFDLVIEGAEMSHSLAMFKCQNVGLEVRNKLNGVTIDNCKRATIVLQDIISSVELIRCQHVRLQCKGHVPLISIDNSDSAEIFLSEKSLDVEVISSKSSSLNISVLKPDGDYVEMAVPEQIKTVVVDGKLVSTVVEKI